LDSASAAARAASCRSLKSLSAFIVAVGRQFFTQTKYCSFVVAFATWLLPEPFGQLIGAEPSAGSPVFGLMG
jgi:hypothetical protein